MAAFNPEAPVLVGVGEASGAQLNIDWPSPIDLASTAIHAALEDSGAKETLSQNIDVLAAIRTFEDSGIAMGTGSPENTPDSYAQAAGLSPAKLIYADVGGQSPQALINELSASLQRGEIKAAIIVSAEAIGAAKRARKSGHTLNWNAKSDREFDNRLSSFPILNKAEIRHGIISMPLAYSLIENARRIRLEENELEYQNQMATLWSEFSKKSLGREHAQFAKNWSAKELQNNTNGNYQLTSMYRRWMVAQDAVDVAGALILTTAGTAKECGIAQDKMIWLTGAAESAEPPLSERQNISGSDAQEFAVEAALDQAGISMQDIGPLDIYSCFPCAVFAAVDTMNDPQRALTNYTLTGGLTFFGGPGNGYSMHSLVAMVQSLRTNGDKPAMVTANGGVMSKQAVGIYSAHQPTKSWSGQAITGYHARKVKLNHAPSGTGKIQTYMRPITRDGMGHATLFVGMESGERALAMLDCSADTHLDGRKVRVSAGEKRHIAQLV